MRVAIAGGWITTTCLAGILTLNSHDTIQALALLTTLISVIQAGRWILKPPAD